MNEVISHVNPSFLDTVWREMARILRPGGMLFISDGNNRANLEVQAVLPELYDKWENGPDGVRTDRDVVEDNFLGRRAKIVAERCPEMTAKQVEFVAVNTSGLFGDVLLDTIERYRTTGELVLRPFQKGMCPVNPTGSGVVMERAIHPIQLELALAEYGFSAHQLKPVPFKPFTRPGLVGLLKDSVVYLRHQLRTLKEDPEDYRSNNVGFQLIAVKQ